MLRKLLKYDLDAVWRIWVPMAVSVPVMSLITALLVRTLLERPESDDPAVVMLGFMMFFAVMTLVILWVGLFIVTPIICYLHYYRHFFSDRGYLTFTLPVPRQTLYLSKVLSTFIWSVGNAVVTLVSACILLLLIPTSQEVAQFVNPIVFDFLGEGLGFLWQSVGPWLILYILELLLILVALSLCNIGLFHLAITMGSVIAKKHKVLCAVGLYLGMNYGISFVSQFFTMFSASPITSFTLMLAKLPLQQQCAALAITGMIVLLLLATVAAIYHFVTLHLIERKLNLA